MLQQFFIKFSVYLKVNNVKGIKYFSSISGRVRFLKLKCNAAMKTKLELWQALESLCCITYSNISDEADVTWRKNDLYGRNAFKVSVLDSLKTPAASLSLCKISCGTRRRKNVPSFFCDVRITHPLFSSFLALLLIIMLTALKPRLCTGKWCYSGCSCNYV